MKPDLEALIPLLVLGLLPLVLLTLIFCMRYALRVASERTLANARLQARLVFRAAAVASASVASGLVVATCLVFVAGAVATEGFAFGKGLVTVIASLISFILILPTIPMFRLVSLLRRYDGESRGELEARIERNANLVERLQLGFLGIIFTGLCFAFFPLAILAIVTIPAVTWMRKRSRESQLLWVLSLTVTHQRDIRRALLEHSRGWSGRYARLLEGLAADLEEGLSLGASLQKRRLVPGWVCSSIRVAEECGCLEEVLRECATNHVQWIRDRFRVAGMSNLILYLVAYCAGVVCIVSFLTYFIVPKFRHIFEGFNTELPKSTELLIVVSNLGSSYFFLIAGPFAVLLVLLVCDYLGWRSHSLPFLSRLYAVFDSGGILKSLARGIRVGDSLPGILNSLAAHHYRSATVVRLQRAMTEIESGKNAWQVLYRQRLLSNADLAVIAAAERAGNLNWALNELAETRERRLTYRTEVCLQILRPAFVLLLGAIVAFICIGMFMPLIELTSGLSIELKY